MSCMDYKPFHFSNFTIIPIAIPLFQAPDLSHSQPFWHTVNERGPVVTHQMRTLRLSLTGCCKKACAVFIKVTRARIGVCMWVHVATH